MNNRVKMKKDEIMFHSLEKDIENDLRQVLADTLKIIMRNITQLFWIVHHNIDDCDVMLICLVDIIKPLKKKSWSLQK